VASPLGITALLLFVSGVPPLEKAADQRWGDQPAYRHYRQRTSLIVPLPPKNREQLNQP
jgi:steroid 5-alpha reductase family enzyme